MDHVLFADKAVREGERERERERDKTPSPVMLHTIKKPLINREMNTVDLWPSSCAYFLSPLWSYEHV